MTDFSSTRIRCSALGSIMTESRGKTNLEKYQDAIDLLATEEVKYAAIFKKDSTSAKNKLEKINGLKESLISLEAAKDDIILSDTCKSYLIQSYVLSKYNRVREIQTKQMVKGTITEEESIQLFSALEKTPYKKNEFRLQNEYISGHPDLHDGDDILTSTEIIDIKSCWDIFTFLSNVEDPENNMYYWQLQGYMALSGAQIGTIAYCLVNTPDSLIEGEKYNLLRKLDVATEEDPAFKNEYAKLIANRKFDDIPMKDRMLTYSIDRNEEHINLMYKKVEKCREFLYEFEEKHQMFSKSYRKTLKKDNLV